MSIISFFTSFLGLIGKAFAFFSHKEAVQEGRMEQRQDDTDADLTASEKERQADVDAPKTAQELEALLDKGEA